MSHHGIRVWALRRLRTDVGNWRLLLVRTLRGITATLIVGVLVGAAMIASSVAALIFSQHGPSALARTAEVAFVASLAVAAVLVIAYLGQMLRRRRQNERE